MKLESWSVRPISFPRSAGSALSASSVTAATYEMFQPRPSRKSETDVQATLSNHASPSVESAHQERPAT